MYLRNHTQGLASPDGGSAMEGMNSRRGLIVDFVVHLYLWHSVQ
jgi:hypothetical protein